MHAQWRRSLPIAYHYEVTEMPSHKMAEEDKDSQIAVYKRAYEREKARREYIEKMLEDKTRELFMSSQELDTKKEALSEAFVKIESQSDVITGLSNDYDRVTEDLSYAAKIQSSLLPDSMDLDTISVVGGFKPAQFLAGDGFDYFSLNDRVFAFYSIDVVGHGSAAAMVSFAVQVLLNPKQDGICQKNVASASNLHEAVLNTLNELNQNFYLDHTTSQYFTMIYGLIDVHTGEVCFGQAGHPPPILLDSLKQETSFHGKGGMPVAMFDSPLFGVYECQMKPGDRLHVYSDGITECRNREDEEFGADNLARCIKTTVKLPIQQSAQAIIDEIVAWNSAEFLEDDVSLLILELK